MKLLVISQYFWPESFRINEIVDSMTSRGHEVEVLTGKPNYPEGDIFPGYKANGVFREEWGGARLLRVPLVPRGPGGAIRLVLNYVSFALTATFIGALQLRGRKYDAIFVYAPSPVTAAFPAVFLGWTKRAPVILWVQDLWPESLSATGFVKNRALLAMVRWAVKWIYKHSDLLLAQSRAFVEPIVKLAGSTPVKYYPNSVDPTFSVPAGLGELPESLKILENGFNVVFAGNIGSAQAIEVIVEAACALRELTDIRFVVIGSGNRMAWMAEEINKRKLTNISFPGRFPVAMMPAVMQNAAALLVTLTDAPIFSLTIPNKVQAYLASGRPIIACLNGEGARIVEESGAGFAVQALSAEGLVQAVLKLHKMKPEERDVLGARGRAYFMHNFEHEKLVDELLDLVRDAATRRGKLA